MQGSFTSRTYTFNILLGRSSFPDYSPRTVSVPQFQRGYSWEKTHVAAFWDDIITFHDQLKLADSADTYFLGPIVIMPRATEMALLDGQQRLATTSILLAAVRDLARQKGGQKGSDLARDIQKDLILVDEEQAQYALQLSELDREYFAETIQQDPPKDGKRPKIRSNRLIKQAKDYLTGQIEAKFLSLPRNELVQALKDFKKTISEKVKIVAIEVASEDEAFLIFETLNDRGLRLSVPDLLLNHLMREANNDQERTQIRSKWNGMLEMIGQGQISTFLRHMWVSKYGDVKKQALYRQIRDHLAKDKVESVEFADTCADECTKYVAIVNCDKAVLGEASEDVKALTKDLAAEKALPLLLSGLCSLEQDDYQKLVRYALSVTVRHSVLANLNPSVLEDALYEAARTIRETYKLTNDSKQSVRAARDRLKGIAPNTKQIEAGLDDLYPAEAACRYLLEKIAGRMQSRTKAVGFDRVSLEHVFPLNPDQTNWPDTERLRPYVWHLGNLTLLEPALNKEAGNQPFAEKVKVYRKSEIAMARQISEKYTQWSQKIIVQRAKSLLIPSVDDLWPL